MEIQEQFEQFKTEMLATIKREITLKVREEVREKLIQHMDKNHKESMGKMDTHHQESMGKMDTHHQESMGKMDTLSAEVATGFLQTHNLLSNIAGILNSNNELLKVIAENTKK